MGLEIDPDAEVVRHDDEPKFIRVRCSTCPVRHELDVPWTKGAIFEFESSEAVEQWLHDQNGKVPGRLFLSRVPGNDTPLSVDYYVKYSSRRG